MRPMFFQIFQLSSHIHLLLKKDISTKTDINPLKLIIK